MHNMSRTFALIIVERVRVSADNSTVNILRNGLHAVVQLLTSALIAIVLCPLEEVNGLLQIKSA